MIAIVRDNLEAIRARGIQHKVKLLFLVGSATDDRFDPSRRDVDFLALFEPHERGGFDGEYFQLLADIEHLLGRNVHLIERHCVENPYVLASLERSRVAVYAQ